MMVRKIQTVTTIAPNNQPAPVNRPLNGTQHDDLPSAVNGGDDRTLTVVSAMLVECKHCSQSQAIKGVMG